jgi:hypothetical protein
MYHWATFEAEETLLQFIFSSEWYSNPQYFSIFPLLQHTTIAPIEDTYNKPAWVTN